ncbi:hypothetical protein KIN20_033310 [Parelaphostrongylus tenuis]|uniref:Uncharacterized protein n=1 Tax=Parelaphostrongylus tenuis TaxID=148309 RepID=A0AAD5R7Z1_PARTN|nr:hypothetical protein KIN20_033310 [Parelaphostrongylus tenuis]
MNPARSTIYFSVQDKNKVEKNEKIKINGLHDIATSYRQVTKTCALLRRSLKRAEAEEIAQKRFRAIDVVDFPVIFKGATRRKLIENAAPVGKKCNTQPEKRED